MNTTSFDHKYNIGDQVFWVADGRLSSICKDTIDGIEFRKDHRIDVFYVINGIQFGEEELFLSRAEALASFDLIDSFKKEIEHNKKQAKLYTENAEKLEKKLQEIMLTGADY